MVRHICTYPAPLTPARPICPICPIYPFLPQLPQLPRLSSQLPRLSQLPQLPQLPHRDIWQARIMEELDFELQQLKMGINGVTRHPAKFTLHRPTKLSSHLSPPPAHPRPSRQAHPPPHQARIASARNQSFELLAPSVPSHLFPVLYHPFPVLYHPPLPYCRSLAGEAKRSAEEGATKEFHARNDG